MTREILLDFLPRSQKNAYGRSAKFVKGGGKVRSLRLSDDFNAEREKLMWLFKQLEPVAATSRFHLSLTISSRKKTVWVRLLPFSEGLLPPVKGTDPDGILTTVLDALRLSGRIADDGIRNVANLTVLVEE